MRVNEKKIIVCSSHAVTGGPELLHQLVHELRTLGRDAHIAYYPFEQKFERPEPYKKYNAPQGPLVDDADTFVLIPETATWIIKRLKQSRPGVWWLSVDNYLGVTHQSKLKDLYQQFKELVKGRTPLWRMRQLLHFTQSHYAEVFLADAGIDSVPLTDYLGRDHLTSPPFTEPPLPRENIIAFSPRKGQRQTRRLIAAFPDMQFVPIQNMTPEEVVRLLRRAKIYIDLGHHPGKDRPPREAAMAGCCVITGRKGSARYHEDVPIPERYKLDDSSPKYVEEFVKLAEQIFADFASHAKDFEDYRTRIRKEPEVFRQQVRDIFG